MKSLRNVAFIIGVALLFAGCGEEAEPTKEAVPKQETASKEETEPSQEAEKPEPQPEDLTAVVHLDDVTGIPNYSIETYKEGDEMPAANGTTMNCTYPECYKVVFDVNGSGQNPTAEYNSLKTKLGDRNILDASYEGADMDIKEVSYWTKDGQITVRLYK